MSEQDHSSVAQDAPPAHVSGSELNQSAVKPKIYVYSAVGGGDGPAYALAEDGACLGSHWCSHEAYARGDLGVEPGSRPDRHLTYAEHYPDGYEMEFIPARALDQHAGFKAAYALNQATPSTPVGE